MDKIEQYSKAIDDFVSIVNRIKDERRINIREGKYVNVFTLWNMFSGLTEPIHSRILHFILSSDPMHGQEKLFLKLFLQRIDIKIQDNEEWIVTAEKGRVDVMLKRYHPSSVIIIENKSNWAGDQPNQLYRYWYQNIHKVEEDCYPDYYKTHPEFKIVYLIPNENKILNDDSRKKPSDYPEELPSELPIEPINFRFDKDISEWLLDCINSLPEENTPLKNLLSQYNEYCKNL